MNADQETLQKIIDLNADLNRIQDLDILLERILTAARASVNADAGSIYVREEDRLAIRYAQNDTQQKVLPPGHKLIYNIFSTDINERTISGFAAKTGRSVAIADVYRIPADAPYHFDPEYDRMAGYRTQSMLTIPLRTNMGEIVGVLQVINAKDTDGAIRAFNDEDESFVTHFASNATLALQRAIMTRAILLRMISMAELRDPHETGTHVNRVASIAVEIYERWAMRRAVDADQIDRTRDLLRMAAMLHDVGKVAIPDHILKKPGRFTDEEFQIMCAHTFLGARLFLDRQSAFDDMAMQVALMHHENWDGSGYPGPIDIRSGRPAGDAGPGSCHGRAGTQIGLYGRIVAVADVYDALRSARVYKNAWTDDDVHAEMRRCAGRKFDPELVDIFFEMLPNVAQIDKRYSA